MWGHEKRGHNHCPWLQGRQETMCTHLKNCLRQPDDVREQAYEVCIARNWIRGAGNSNNIKLNNPPQQNISLPLQPQDPYFHCADMSSYQSGVPLPFSANSLSNPSTSGSGTIPMIPGTNWQAPTPTYLQALALQHAQLSSFSYS